MKPITLPELLMGALAVVCLLIVYIGLGKALQRTGWPPQRRRKILRITGILFISWLVLTGVLAARGVLSNFTVFPPRPLLLVFLPIALAVVLAFTNGFKNVLSVVPPHWLVLFQSFRIVVELLLWRAFTAGLLPVQMTFEGRNFDMIAGILALVAGWLMARRTAYTKTIGVVYNLIGLALLINIMAVSILSMPTPMQVFKAAPANTLVTTFPFVYLPTVLVVLAFSFHLFSLRQLWLKNFSAVASNHQLQPQSMVGV